MDNFDYEETGSFGRYDEDFSDSRQYCKHGTFIGSWWGPDYLCYYCETGNEPPPPATWRAQVWVNGVMTEEKGGYSREEVWTRKGSRPYGFRSLFQCFPELHDSLSFVLEQRRVTGWVAVDRV